MSSLSDQLLKAGLVTEEQVKNAAKPRKKYSQNKQTTKASRQASTKNTNKNNSKKNKKELSDLEKFYALRSNEEKKEKQNADRIKKEQARLKKEMNVKVNQLISANIIQKDSKNKETDKAEIRYNFVVGTTIKYIFVTQEQQEQLAKGELAITFNKGQKCIIPADIVSKIHAIDPNKIVVQALPE